MEQVVENVEGAGRSGAGLLTADELTAVDRVRAQYQALATRRHPLHPLPVLQSCALDCTTVPALPQQRRHPRRIRDL